MSYRQETNATGRRDIVIDGFEKGIASSPYTGIANIQSLNTAYYPDVAYVNYKRQAATISFTGTSFWYAGTHSTNVSGNLGWIFAASSTPSMTNPVDKATSPAGLSYILDDSGQIFKQNSVNSSTFTNLSGGTGRLSNGAGGIAFWNNYLVVFGNGLIEFCGDGSGDAGVTSSNWNRQDPTSWSTTFTAVTSPSEIHVDPFGFFYQNALVGDPVTFTTTGTLPAPLVTGQTYYITSITTGSTYKYQVSLTSGGSDIAYTTTGTGVHTMTDNNNPLPIGNVTALNFTTVVPAQGETSSTLVSYISPRGEQEATIWKEATGQWAVIDPNGTKLLAVFTYGSSAITWIAPLVSLPVGAYTARIIEPSQTKNVPYVSKVDGNLYFSNGRYLGRILSQNVNTVFNPSNNSTYVVDYGVTALLQSQDAIQGMTDLKSTLVLAGNKDTYPWDYTSPTPESSSPVGEQIFKIVNLLNNIYILAGQKGNLYVSNGYSSQLLYKIPDYIAGIIDPVWTWGDLMVHRSRLFFQLLAQTTAGANILSGTFSLTVSPSAIGETASGLVMESQNSYGLTPASGATAAGVLIDNSPSSTGYDSYYSAWSNGASTGGIDFNNTTLWDNFEPTIETDIIPIGDFLSKRTLGLIEFKLDRPMATGDQIRMYSRTSLSDSYTLMGTTTLAQLSDYYQTNIFESQWAQFKIQFKCAASGSSFIPLREVRLHLQ